MVDSRAAYPRYFLTPEGRRVSIRRMGEALRTIRSAPDADYPGWDWFLVPGHHILREFRRGMDDRINKRAALKASSLLATPPLLAATSPSRN